MTRTTPNTAADMACRRPKSRTWRSHGAHMNGGTAQCWPTGAQHVGESRPSNGRAADGGGRPQQPSSGHDIRHHPLRLRLPATSAPRCRPAPAQCPSRTGRRRSIAGHCNRFGSHGIDRSHVGMGWPAASQPNPAGDRDRRVDRRFDHGDELPRQPFRHPPVGRAVDGAYAFAWVASGRASSHS